MEPTGRGDREQRDVVCSLQIAVGVATDEPRSRLVAPRELRRRQVRVAEDPLFAFWREQVGLLEVRRHPEHAAMAKLDA